MENYGFDEENRSFAADDFSIILSDDNNSYHIVSQLDPECKVDVTVTRTVPGFKVGKDAKTGFGTDPQNPWGAIRHIFWPKAKSEGVLEVKGEKVDSTGGAIYVMAMQSMKPHHAGTSHSGGFILAR